MYREKYDLSGRVAVVTGGGQGIGLASAQALGEAGAKVIVADLLPDRAENAVQELGKLGIAAAPVALDVTQSDQVDAAAARIEREHGPVAILVNNAGVAKSNVRAEDTSDEHWRFHIEVNLNGLFWCCRAFGRQMLERGQGSIVNVGSMSGFIVNKPQPQSFYNASKAAVHHLTRSLAAECPAAPEQPVEVDLDVEAPVLVAGVLGADVALGDAGIVDQDRDRPMLPLDPRRSRVDLIRLGDVHRQRSGRDAEPAELLDRLLRAIGQEVRHDHLGARFAQRLRARQPDALAAAGDHGDPAGEVVFLPIHFCRLMVYLTRDADRIAMARLPLPLLQR